MINNKQKRVDTDLALTLMQAMAAEATEDEVANLVGPGNKFRIRATRLVVQIAQMDTSPWAGKIEEPNVPPNPMQIASIKSFVDSLRPIVSVRSPVYGWSDDELVDAILSIWTGVLNLHAEWERNPARYAVQRAIGLFVIHRVARELLIPKMLRTHDRSPASVTDTLSQATRWLDEGFWRTGGQIGTYSSGAGQRELANQIINAIP